ncbi:MAG: hypothetical protein WC071_14020 [Victivallaceae bacterium]
MTVIKKFSLVIAGAIIITLISTGCKTKIPAGDVDIYEKYSDEIAVLKNDKLKPNTQEKYEAAKTLAEDIDFSFLRSVSTIDRIFSTKDAHIDNPNSINQLIIFYYQYGKNSVRFCFRRHNNSVTSSEVKIND